MDRKEGKILIVDDSYMNRETLKEILKDYSIIEADNGHEAIELIEKHHDELALILLDIVMPEKSGFDVLKFMNEQNYIKKIPVTVISVDQDLESVEKAYQLGAIEYLTRPFLSIVVLKKVENTFNLYNRQMKMTTIVNEQVYEKYKNNDMMTIILSHIVESKNGESGIHVIHIKILTRRILEALMKKTNKYHLSQDDTFLIEAASTLHDIGKISIPNEILNKPGKLTEEEKRIMQDHAVTGAKMLENLPFYKNEPLVKYAREICHYHHERYDGRGYPEGLIGDEIPISAQAVSIVDAYDALISERVYKKAIDGKTALKMIQEGKCGAFNPLLIECLSEIQLSIEEELNKNYLFEQRDYINNKADELIKEKGI